jgi:hypothetical protein
MKSILVIGLAALCAGPAVAAGDLDDEGPSGDMAVEPLIWEPTIPDFYAVPRVNAEAWDKSNAYVELSSQGEALVGEWENWRKLQALIAPRPLRQEGGDAAYAPDETVFSGWRRAVTENGAVIFQTCGTHTEPQVRYWDRSRREFTGTEAPQVFTVYSPGGRGLVTVVWSLDVLTNVDDLVLRERMLRDHFKVVELKVTAHRVSPHMQEYRGAAHEKTDEYFIRELRSVGSPSEVIGEDFVHFRIPMRGMTMREWESQGEGVWEFRIRARVAGRAGTFDDVRTKTVEGAIRVAFWENKTFSAERLVFSMERKN